MLVFKTNNPSTLLASIKTAIDKGHITTWSYDSEGDFTHTPAQWVKKAWMRPAVIAGTQLDFGIIRNQGQTIPREIYAVYHGRFIEMMIAHFSTSFISAGATPNASGKDLV